LTTLENIFICFLAGLIYGKRFTPFPVNVLTTTVATKYRSAIYLEN